MIFNSKMHIEGDDALKNYVIIDNKKCNYHIVGANFSTSCDRFAASQLQKYIYDSTGVFIPYFSDRCDKRGPEIIVGIDTRNAKSLVSREEIDSLGEEGCLIKTLGEDILIAGKTSRGTLYGAYEFLERFLGLRVFTKDVETLERKESLIIPETYIKVIPDFEYRDAYFRFAFDGDFCAKNRLNTTLGDISAEKGGNLKFYNCHHAADDLVAPSIYFDEHPEYFAEVDGKRTPDQLCLSNPNVIEIATNTVKRWIKENPECRVFSVAQNDNQEYCRCKNCRSIDEKEGTPAATNILFANKIAAEIEKTNPYILLHTFAYQYTRIAPKTVKPRHNVIVRLCNIECEWGKSIEEIAVQKPESKTAEFLNNIKEWSAICDRLYIWDYAVNFSHYLMPFPNFYSMAENIKIYKKYGVKGMLQQGNFSYGGGAALDDLKSYMIARLTVDSSLDPDKLIFDFTEAVYGKGGKYIREYIRLITLAAEDQKLTLYDHPNAPYIDDNLVILCDKLFKMAEDAESGETRKRIEREHLSIEYLKAVRIEDDRKRAEAVDAFAEKVRAFRLTEIMERINLDISFDMMKQNRYASDRSAGYRMYYIVR